MKDFLLGIDIGTSGCKIAAIDPQGHVIDETFGEYETFHPHPGHSEQDPEDWWRTVCTLLHEMFARGKCKPDDVAALSVDGSTHNAVLTDAGFVPLRPAIMWTDQRSGSEAAALSREAGNLIFRTTYETPSPTWTLSHLRWLQVHEPQVLSRTEHVLFTKDYVRFRLTGDWVTDHIEAQGSLLYDVQARSWSEELCGLVGLRTRTLPMLANPTDVAGTVTAAAESATGLREGTPVIVGCPDSAVEDYAAGAIEAGQMVIKLATAGNVNVMTTEPHPHAKTLTYSHVIPGLWYTVVATNTAASAERWFRDQFCTEQVTRAREQGRSAFALMHEEAAGVPPGANGLFFHPYLLGERAPYWDPHLRGSFVGATMSHHKAHFLRALLEGVAFSLRDCFRTIEEMALPIKEIRLIGGGAKSSLWAQIVSDVFGCSLKRPTGCDASFGAALLAGVGIGLFSNEAEAVRRCSRVQDTFQPDPQATAIYSRLFPFYCRIHDNLAGTYRAFDQFLEETQR